MKQQIRFRIASAAVVAHFVLQTGLLAEIPASSERDSFSPYADASKTPAETVPQPGPTHQSTDQSTDGTTGKTTDVAADIPLAPVPEPGTLMMLGGGLFALFGIQRMRNRQRH